MTHKQLKALEADVRELTRAYCGRNMGADLADKLMMAVTEHLGTPPKRKRSVRVTD